MPKLHRSNRIVHGMWVGPTLSRLELLTLRSFTQAGHEFHLWLYQKLDQPLPTHVVPRDAREILSEQAIFQNRYADGGSGVGQGSVGAFSDLFRYKLLYEEGGIWVDMDVTCLRPFEIETEYLFRSHQIGAVGNIMKCPKNSPVMRDAYEAAAEVINPQSTWMAANQILNQQITKHKLTHLIRDDFCNPDDWRNAVAPMVWEFRQPHRAWHAIHWLNEYWRGLQDGRITEHGPKAHLVPTRQNPPPGGLLYELYRFYGLIDSCELQCVGLETPGPRRSKPAPRRAPPFGTAALHINMLIPHLIRGGAERMVLDLAAAFTGTDPGKSARIYVKAAAQRQYKVKAALEPEFTILAPQKNGWDVRTVAMGVLGSPTPVLFTHLITARDLVALWEWGVVTVPVIHNSRPGWQDDPEVFAHANVPFVVAVSEAIAAELRAANCPKPVIPLRHELPRRFEPRAMMLERKRIRDRHGIGLHTLLVGMVGQFKSQKAYTRAVRVLAEMRQICDVRLMIVGGWEHDYGNGRAAYKATCRLAVELDVIADMIMLGDVEETEPYFAAFDVFLNTSVHEGLSIAVLEAVAAGCPIVVADAGGNREVLPPDAVLVKDGSDIAAYVRGISKFLHQPPRLLPNLVAAPKLVPTLWAALARYGVSTPISNLAAPSGTLFITRNLHVGGAQRSLVNLLAAFPKQMKTALCVLGGASQPEFLEILESSEVINMFLDGTDFSAQAVQIVEIADRLNFRNICFWNVSAEVKLSLGKILQLRKTRLIDVSPGPMLFDDLEAAAMTCRRLAFDTDAYFNRLDVFVTKYEGGNPALDIALPADRVKNIPNGVPEPPHFIALPPPEHIFSKHFDPELAVGTCCRLVPDKHLEFLIEMMKLVVTEAPRASLTIVGGPEGEDSPYYVGLVKQIADENLKFIRLVGRQEDVNRYLATFKIFVMVSDRQGCPNASLEAMAIGLPVISNRSGGIAEQVQDGLNGYLVDTPLQMAARVCELLHRPAQRQQFGEAGRLRAATHFSMPQMVQRYQALLEGP
jgi:glycosyltransferase involved in cell wall biosynthesis